MKNLIIALFLTLFFGASAYAGGSHSHGENGSHSLSHKPVSSEAAMNRAALKVNQLVSKGVIDSSWKNIPADSAEQKKFSEGLEWVVRFKNKKIDDAKKQTLYLFLSLDGHYIAANYSGK